jgi:hypothetical protein
MFKPCFKQCHVQKHQKQTSPTIKKNPWHITTPRGYLLFRYEERREKRKPKEKAESAKVYLLTEALL